MSFHGLFRLKWATLTVATLPFERSIGNGMDKPSCETLIRCGQPRFQCGSDMDNHHHKNKQKEEKINRRDVCMRCSQDWRVRWQVRSPSHHRSLGWPKLRAPLYIPPICQSAGAY
ncbi:hypothetical protein L210DRAFT_2178841 [Boletus edulis BED1]|uniref:Secreted protein n=1 Tax=Boletus edulis BED1 TaxID=1328754 RepID=A0AAD4GED0_BOLED|nr:hypothetical protein L210DRAFT_2178841 [Boletus edulis BED1]